MSPYPMEGTGSIIMNLLGSVEQATFELIGGSGKPFYYGAEGSDPDLPYTRGGAGGGFVEIAPESCCARATITST